MGKTSWYRVALVGAIAIVLLNTWFAARALRTLIAAQFWEAHTLQVISQTETLVAQVRTAESSARGYILTGMDVYETRYAAAVNQIHESIANLQRLTGDNTRQQVRIAELNTRIGAKLSALDAGLAVRRVQPHGALDPALLGPVLQDTPDRMDSVQMTIHDIEAEEQGLLAERTADADLGAALGVGQLYAGVCSGLSSAGRGIRTACSHRARPREDCCKRR